MPNAVTANEAADLVRQRLNLPRFEPPVATLARGLVSPNGDSLVVGLGSTNERNFAKNGVSMIFAPGAAVIYTGSSPGGLIDDTPAGTGVAIAATIEGDVFSNDGSGVFDAFPADGDATYDTLNCVVNMRRAGSVINLKANTIGSTHAFDGTAVGTTLNQSNGRLTVNAGRILSGQYSTCLYWWNAGGECYINADVIAGSDSAGLSEGTITTAVDATATGELYLRAHIVTGAGRAFEHQDGHASARCWFNGISLIEGGSSAIFHGLETTSLAKYYYTGCGKITTTAAASTVISVTTGIYWMDFQKLTIPAGGSYGLHVSSAAATTMDLTIAQLECLGAATNIALINAASASIHLCIRRHTGTSTSGGIKVTAGTLRLSDSRIDTTANASTAPLSGAASQTIYLKNVHLQSGAAASITNYTGSGTLTVVCLGACTANVAVGANVTVVGTLTVNAAFA